jgi:long-chain acyl-CoA synthetase
MENIESATLPGLAEWAATNRPGVVGFLVPWKDGFHPISYDEWWGGVARVAAGLRREGVGPRDRVLLMMETRYEWLLSDLAILSCGALCVPIYPNLPPGQMAHPLGEAKPRAAIVSRPELLARLLRAPGATENLAVVFLLEGEAPEDSPVPVRALRAILDGPPPTPAEEDDLRRLRDALQPQDPATVLYTSGTSSTPKGVVLKHESILSNVRMISRALPFDASDRYLSILPLAHTLERTVQYTMLANGVTIAYGRGMDALSRDAMVVQPTFLLGVPRLFEQICRSAREAARARGWLASRLFAWAEASALRRGSRGPVVRSLPVGEARAPRGLDGFWDRKFYRPIREKLGGQVRYVVSGSAPLSRRELMFFCGAGLPLLEGYGLTEAGPVVSVNTLGEWRVGSVGKPLPGVDVRIAEDGEILLASPSLMAGYYNLEAESMSALEGGWLHTGDLGVLDSDGFLTITGRKKDMIVTSGGKNISPGPIEERLRESPWIQEAVVFGDRRPYLVAMIAVDRKAVLAHMREAGREDAGETEIRSLLRAHVDRVNHDFAPHERIRSFGLLDEAPSIEAGTLTPTLKVRRSAFESQHAEKIAALYESRRR